MRKKPKHKEIIKDYNKIKSKHLENLASDMLKKDERAQKLKERPIKKDFLDLF